MSNQQQDLIFFQDNSLLSEEIITSESSVLSVISHVQGTSPSWLLNSLIENGLNGTATLINNDLNKKRSNRAEVFFVSFLHSKDFYIQNCKKNGLDLGHFTNFHFIDCFTNLFTKYIKDFKESSRGVSEIFGQIEKQVEAVGGTRKIVFIEGLELLLLSNAGKANDLLSHILKLNRKCRHLLVVSAQDSPQIVKLHANTTQDPAFEVSDFLVKLYHRSQLNINLQPLATGRANDITGSLTISRGSVPVESIIPGLRVVENEYIYHVTKDASIKLFYR
ncbi:uncharacterized protein CANTADRAFT_22891 [Suhomyces tanzawaensis NRRL Y-17324]|uniref:Elongator complex protein 6 n=1 Tax=Suhomyces tanzawaensis NRRL Y-17324 TaxID=984487 RepID=A0A1E4SE57_9ASCO|nr:uncharacterized protein CANTADRAFT_22891 [Suhomyces tanzawaensis NRRL Y-17324]ODV77768.1 hypothetical protein CANTADRAFT_22891 [Suhomyces tanzawaensis NRRL Y-17324]